MLTWRESRLHAAAGIIRSHERKRVLSSTIRPFWSIVTQATVVRPAKQRTPLVPIAIVSASLCWAAAAVFVGVLAAADVETDEEATGWPEFELHPTSAAIMAAPSMAAAGTTACDVNRTFMAVTLPQS